MHFLSVLANILFVSIPEEIYIVILCLILLRKFEFLKLKSKSNSLRLGIAATSSAVISNVLKVLNIELSFSAITLIVTMLIIMCVVYKIKTFKHMVILFFSIVLASASIAVIEILYIPIILSTTNKSIDYFLNSIFLRILISVPERTIQYFMIFYIIVNKFRFQKTNPLFLIAGNKFYILTSLVLTSSNILFLICATNSFVLQKLLSGFSFEIQVVILLCACMFPIINIMLFWTMIYYHKAKKDYETIMMKFRTKSLIDSFKFKLRNHPDQNDSMYMLEKIKKTIGIEEDVI